MCAYIFAHLFLCLAMSASDGPFLGTLIKIASVDHRNHSVRDPFLVVMYKLKTSPHPLPRRCTHLQDVYPTGRKNATGGRQVASYIVRQAWHTTVGRLVLRTTRASESTSTQNLASENSAGSIRTKTTSPKRIHLPASTCSSLRTDVPVSGVLLSCYGVHTWSVVLYVYAYV